MAEIILSTGDIKELHYDSNFFFNEIVESSVRRAQYGQPPSISHAVSKTLAFQERSGTVHNCSCATTASESWEP